MKILRDISVSLTPAEVARAQQTGRRRARPPKPWLLETAERAIAMSQPLIEPAAVYAQFEVQGVADGRLTLAVPAAPSGERAGELSLGPKANLLAPAQRVMVAVYTIGPALEERVHALQADGEGLLAFMLDSVGVLALGAVGQRLRELAEEQAQALGWGLSPALSPGSLVGWPLQGQRALCRLLPLDEIDVRLNDRFVLEPHKSVSVLIGLGPDYSSTRVGSVCGYCALADSCWRRREAEVA